MLMNTDKRKKFEVKNSAISSFGYSNSCSHFIKKITCSEGSRKKRRESAGRVLYVEEKRADPGRATPLIRKGFGRRAGKPLAERRCPKRLCNVFDDMQVIT